MVQHHYLLAVDGTLKWNAAYPWTTMDPRGSDQTDENGGHRLSSLRGGSHLGLPAGYRHSPDGRLLPKYPVEAASEAKQDSELKAFYRLARRPKTAFHRLKLTILADGLYPNGLLFRFLRDQRWDFMIVLKASNLKAFQADAKRERALVPKNICHTVWGNGRQQFWWVNDLEYEWDDPVTGRLSRTALRYAVCEETWTDGRGDHHSTWAWVSARPPVQSHGAASVGH